MRFPLRLPLLTLAAVLLPAAAGCAGTTLPAGPTPGEYFFEVDYANFAWSPTRTGVVIDASGDVWSFDYGQQAESDTQKDGYTGAELAAKYAHGRHLLRHVDATEVAAHATKIAQAAEGPLGPEVSRCADAGIRRFHGFRYDAATDTYRPVLLHQEGDAARRNLSPAAAELVGWLRTLDAAFGQAECEP